MRLFNKAILPNVSEKQGYAVSPRKYITAFFFIATGLFFTTLFSGCYYDKEEELYPPGVAGPKFSRVRNLVNNRCGNSACHLSGGMSGGVNFDDQNRIVSLKDRIKVRAVDGAPSPMPVGAPLPQTEKDIILEWINAGGRLSD
jgi:uncharacterized membrane protein